MGAPTQRQPPPSAPTHHLQMLNCNTVVSSVTHIDSLLCVFPLKSTWKCVKSLSFFPQWHLIQIQYDVNCSWCFCSWTLRNTSPQICQFVSMLTHLLTFYYVNCNHMHGNNLFLAGCCRGGVQLCHGAAHLSRHPEYGSVPTRRQTF